MQDDAEVFVSRADIARLADVHRPAVANWERRYPDFPQPAQVVDGIERFSAADIMAWLESRRIPRNARSASEPDGASYGDRFRRNLQGSDTPNHVRSTQTLVEQLTQSSRVNIFRGALDVKQYRDLLLTLTHAAGCQTSKWLALGGGLQREDNQFLSVLRDILSEAELGHLTTRVGVASLSPRQVEEVLVVVRLLDREIMRSPSKSMRISREVFAGLLEQFAEREGKRAGDMYTPHSVTRLAARILAATGAGDSIYDPFCRAGEFLAAVVTEAMSGRDLPGKLRAAGAHPNVDTCRIAEMHLDLYDVDREVRRGLDVAPPGNSVLGHDLVVSNPPFNMRLDEQVVRGRRWRYGEPPSYNGNFAWLQHVLTSLSSRGRAAVVMANNACFSAGSHDRKIRAALVEDGVVACLVALPPQLFSGTGVPCTLWILDRERRHPEEILFLDATSLGTMTSRTSRVLSEGNISELTETFAEWWFANPGQPFGRPRARRVPLAEVREHDYSLNPLSYVDPPVSIVEVGEQAAKIRRLAGELRQLRGSAKETSEWTPVLARVDVEPKFGSRSQTRNTLVGEVPANWSQLPLGRLAEIQPGPSLEKEPSVPGGVPVVHPRDLRHGWIADEAIRRLVSASEAMIDRYALLPGDVLCVRAGELGRHGVVGSRQSGWLFSSGLLRVRTADGVVPNYVAHYLGLPEVRDWIRRHATGTAVPSINREVLAELPVVIPPIEVQRRIGRALDLAQEEARVHEQLAEVAVRFRDAIAPLMMTGVLPPD